MDTLRHARGLRRTGLIVFLLGLVISVFGLRASSAWLPFGIMAVLLGTVVFVIGAVEDLSA